jgi:hypothetical protein
MDASNRQKLVNEGDRNKRLNLTGTEIIETVADIIAEKESGKELYSNLVHHLTNARNGYIAMVASHSLTQKRPRTRLEKKQVSTEKKVLPPINDAGAPDMKTERKSKGKKASRKASADIRSSTQKKLNPEQKKKTDNDGKSDTQKKQSFVSKGGLAFLLGALFSAMIVMLVQMLG